MIKNHLFPHKYSIYTVNDKLDIAKNPAITDLESATVSILSRQ